jgi:hypothetical protein
MAGEGAVLLAAQGEEVTYEITDATVVGESDAGLADLAELEVEVGLEPRVARIDGQGGGGGRLGGGSFHTWGKAIGVPTAWARMPRVMSKS